MKKTEADLAAGILRGDKRAASELMSLVEDGGFGGESCLRRLYAAGKKAHVVGVTGWPGVGKSTLVNRMARFLLEKDKQVGVIAIDPTSPFSGGSLLGDRERMKEIDGDPRLFIRSAATRGHPGGITRTTKSFIKIMEAMGKDVILLETVGVGQNEVSVIQVADTVVLTVIPGMGDYLQSLKAGVFEIGDIFAVNKADREGAGKTVSDLRMLIGLNGCGSPWTPPIVKTVATSGEGIEELMSAITRHSEYADGCDLGLSRRASSVRAEIFEIIQSRILRRLSEHDGMKQKLESYGREVCEGTKDPYSAADEILEACKATD
jgi:LAO/AO transport system kinase